MKKLTVLLLALAMFCTCFALAACGDDGDTSSAASSDASSATSSDASSATSSESTANKTGTLWLTHYASVGNEGSGTVFTENYSGGEWWLHIAFKPVDGEDGVYEIVKTSDGIAAGGATALEVPEGGFVYAVNTGNNYSASDPNGINYASENVVAMVREAQTWKVGEKFTFTGIDLENLTEIPTSTEGTNWYDPSYVCTATYTKVG